MPDPQSANGGGTPPPNPPISKTSIWGLFRAHQSAVLTGAVLALGIAAFAAIVSGYLGAYQLNLTSKAPPEPGQTEALFLDQAVRGSSAGKDIRTEWLAARADHKIIAYAIANCSKFRTAFGNTDTMPRQLFNALLLNLTPDGEHRFSIAGTAGKDNAAVGSQPKANASDAAPLASIGRASIELTSYQQTMVFLSDAIARARLHAASEASGNLPDMRLFGWFSVLISAIATLLVTIKGSMTVPASGAPGRWFKTVGVLAIIASAAGTTLASVKQFYDPARTYRTSEAALLELRKLHTEAGLSFVRNLDPENCTSDPAVFDRNIAEWSKTLSTVEAAIIMASANLQDTDRVKLDPVIRPDADSGKPIPVKGEGPERPSPSAAPTSRTLPEKQSSSR
jgi:hypothetical protein